jgi:hypothetical protein
MIAVSFGSSIFINFLRNSILFSIVAILSSHQQCTKTPISSHPHQHLSLYILFVVGFFGGVICGIELGLNSGICTCKAGALPLELHCRSC